MTFAEVNAGRFCMSAILRRILHQLRFCCFSAMQLLQYKFCLNYLKDNVTSLVIKIRYNDLMEHSYAGCRKITSCGKMSVK